MTDLTNCPNCGAPADLTAKSCPYCGTPYPKPRKTAQAVAIAEPPTLHIDGAGLAACVDMGLITRNEARRRLGLPEL